MRLSILYLGDSSPSSTAGHRAAALKRLGHAVVCVNPADLLGSGPILSRVHYRTGYRLGAPRVAKRLARLDLGAFDIGWVNGGEQLNSQALADLRRACRLLIHYTTDDPFRPDWEARWATFRRSVPAYDLLVVSRPFNVAEAYAAGAANVLRVRMSYDEVAHSPPAMSPEDQDAWHSRVLFCGTWMPERGPLLASLIRRGVPLTIRGDRWKRAPEYSELRDHIAGGPVYARDYAKAICGAEVCLGLLSRANRDDHTHRSVEVPALGTVLCAERTPEHQTMYKENVEAVFWSDAEECAERSAQLLADPEERDRIARAGQLRARGADWSNERTLSRILEHARTRLLQDPR